MQKTRKQLLNIWFNVWEYPGWLNILEMSKAYTPEEIDILEDIDEEAIAYTKEAEKEYFEDKPRIRAQLKEFEQELDQDYIQDLRLRYLAKEIRTLNNRIRFIRREEERRRKINIPLWLQMAFKNLDNVEELNGQLKRLTVEKHFLENPRKAKATDWVTQREIARALIFPFEDLLYFNKADFALCPFHEEKNPSLRLYRKTNTVYCFSCNWSGNTIQYLRKTMELSFKDAVRKLL